MPEVYKKCFIGLRLCQNDGCATTVQEMGMMNIPVIHNGDYINSIKWNDASDIINIINLFYNNLKHKIF